MAKIRVVHYLNQFFAGVGGEEKAGTPPVSRDGPVGPGKAFQEVLGQRGEIVGTVFCGDNYFHEDLERTKREVLDLIAGYRPDVLVAGPAFSAGRYGLACAHVCLDAVQRLKIPAVGGQHPDNPGVGLCRSQVYIVVTGETTAGMRQAITTMAELAWKLAMRKTLGTPEVEGYLPRGVRRNVFVGEDGAERAVKMLLQKIRGELFTTELPLPTVDAVKPPLAVKDLKEAVVALVTESGIVPKGNPDHLESAQASKWIKYDIRGKADLTGEEFMSAHGGYDNRFGNEDPDRLVPLDVMRELEQEGRFKQLLNHYYVTVGNCTSVESGRQYGKEIATELLAQGVQAVVLTGT